MYWSHPVYWARYSYVTLLVFQPRVTFRKVHWRSAGKWCKVPFHVTFLLPKACGMYLATGWVFACLKSETHAGQRNGDQLSRSRWTREIVRGLCLGQWKNSRRVGGTSWHHCAAKKIEDSKIACHCPFKNRLFDQKLGRSVLTELSSPKPNFSEIASVTGISHKHKLRNSTLQAIVELVYSWSVVTFAVHVSEVIIPNSRFKKVNLELERMGNRQICPDSEKPPVSHPFHPFSMIHTSRTMPTVPSARLTLHSTKLSTKFKIFRKKDIFVVLRLPPRHF